MTGLFDRGGPHGVSRGSARGLFFVAFGRTDARPIGDRPPQSDV